MRAQTTDMYRRLQADWRPGPGAPQLRAAGVDVWRLDLARPGPDDAGGSAWRAAAHRAREDILARYLGRSAEPLAIGVRPGGKPYLVSPAGALAFNLSHCRAVGLLAVASGLELGVDIEAQRPIPDPLRLARRVMAGPDVQRLERSPQAAREDLFFELWTRLEARQKAFGRGIFARPVDGEQVASFGFRADATHIGCLAVVPRVARLSVRFFDHLPP